jgi:hypothetical protein
MVKPTIIFYGVGRRNLPYGEVTMIRFWLKLVSIALLFVLVACDQGGTPGSSVSPEMEDSVGWVVGNISPSAYSSGSGPLAVIDLSVAFEDTTIAATNIESVEVTNSLSAGRSWSFPSESIEDYFFTSPSTGKRVLSFSFLSTDFLAANKSAIYMGTYNIEVTLKNGRSAKQTLAVPAPDATTSQGYSYMYSPENYPGTPPSGYVALPKLATIGATAIDATGGLVTINFSVNDPKVYSGWVWFFDANGKYLGYAGSFRDFETKALYGKLNGGQAFHNDGVNNILALTAADIEVSSEVSNFNVSMIKKVRMFLTDGRQYAAQPGSLYDTYSLTVGTVQ